MQQQPQGVLASSRTIQALQASATPNANEDPWIHCDPWARPNPREMPTSQVASLETRLEQSILSKMKQNHALMPDTDAKVAELEERLDQLGRTVQSNHNEAARQHQVLQNQLTALGSKVDQQQRIFQSTLEANLNNRCRGLNSCLAKDSVPTSDYRTSPDLAKAQEPNAFCGSSFVSFFACVGSERLLCRDPLSLSAC